MKVYLNCPGASEFDSASTQPTTPFPSSCAIHHLFTTRFTRRPLRVPASHAMVQPDGGFNLWSRASRFELAGNKIWRHHEISHFALSAHFCSGCIVNLDGPCRVQQLDHQRHVRLYNPRNSFPSGRVLPYSLMASTR